MASPEQNRVGGGRPAGSGGVRNLLAMFEKPSPSSGSPAPSGTNPVNPAAHDQSPGPRPQGRVRTSFVAVQGNGNPILGLKATSPSSPMSPVMSISDGAKLFGGPLGTASGGELGEPAHKKQPLDEANLRKHDLETRNGYTAPSFSSMGTGLPPSPEIISIKQAEVIPQKPLDSKFAGKDAEEPAKPVKAEAKPVKAEAKPVKVEAKPVKAEAKPVKAETKMKTTAPKAGPAPKSPTKSMFSSNKANKMVPSTKSGKNLTLPPSKSTTTSPLPSPALPKSPVRSAASSSSSGSRVKPSTTASGTGSSSARTRAAASTSTTATAALATSAPAASKSRQPIAATEKAKVHAAKKVEPKVVREPSKPPTIRSSAFAPTTASATKLAADQKAAAARSRPPSSASARNRSPPTASGMRRGNSGTGSAPVRRDQRSPQRPQTSAAIRNPNRTSVGSAAAVAPATGGGDFLSRMMRPTTASSSRVGLDKKAGPVNPPPKRPASVASTSRRREKSLPPSTGRLHKQTTGEGPKVEEKASTVVAEKPEETPTEITEIQTETVNSSEGVINTEVLTEVLTEVTVETEVQESEDGCQSPTTTTSSTTLVHEGEGKDDDEIFAKE